ncbi:MAG: 3-hydroxyacyl-ACP dehydratase FabZ family protein [Oscillospiraceae bacterium]|nr:3-hydroxyacyl-ACP dehydratase FabZ family protein [Oscillospiraceae bacterium]
MNQEEVKRILPHRDNMLLIDEVCKEENIAHGKYRVRGDEWFLQGHFPKNPIVPGVILCEMLAQSACVLLSGAITNGKLPMFTGLNNVRFKVPVKPGDIFESECRIVRAKPPFYFAEGKGFVAGELCIRAEFSFAITGA